MGHRIRTDFDETFSIVLNANRPLAHLLSQTPLLTTVEEQSNEYTNSKLKYLNNDPLPFVYESTGDVTRFTNFHDPKPRSRPVFTFQRPETFRNWIKKEKSLRKSLLEIPILLSEGLRDCQTKAITKLENSIKEFKPKALIQMAT